METAFIIWAYLAIGDLCRGVSTVGGVLLVIYIFYGAMFIGDATGLSKEERAEQWAKWAILFKRGLIVWICALVLFCLYPDKQEMKYIIGGTTVYNLSQNSEAQKLPTNVLKAANSFLDAITAASDKATEALSPAKK